MPVPEEVETADNKAFVSNAKEEQVSAEETSSEEERAESLDAECEENDENDGE